MLTMKPCVKLEDWAVVPGLRVGIYQDLRPGNLLIGRAIGHKRIKTGMFIFTTPIVRVDAENGIAETENTTYCLGKASPEYLLWSVHQHQVAAA